MKASKLFFTALFFALACNYAQAQKTTDVNFIFKMYLFLNSTNISNNNIQAKDDRFFNYFMNNTTITVDTLTSTGFDHRFLFLSLKQVNIKRAKNTDIGNNCTAYKLFIDLASGKAFRLGGFDNNDMLNLFAYLQGLQLTHTKTFTDFLGHHSVDGIDFQCLYEAARAVKYDPQKYPCAKRCSDLMVIY